MLELILSCVFFRYWHWILSGSIFGDALCSAPLRVLLFCGEKHLCLNLFVTEKVLLFLELPTSRLIYFGNLQFLVLIDARFDIKSILFGLVSNVMFTRRIFTFNEDGLRFLWFCEKLLLSWSWWYSKEFIIKNIQNLSNKSLQNENV